MASRSLWKGGAFDFFHGDPWNQHRSRLNHTEFGNRVLGIWADSSRWDAVIAHMSQAGESWSQASRQVWEESFERWQKVRGEMLEHACRIEQGFRPLRAGEEFLCGRAPHIEFCIRVAQLLLKYSRKYAAWVQAVGRAVAAVDHAVVQLGPPSSGLGSGMVPRLLNKDEIRNQLGSLAKAARHLKEVFSGRGYFNYGHSD